MNHAISEIKRVFTTRLDTLDHILGIGDTHFAGGRYCELTGHRYVADWLMPNLYFHITTAYAILRMLGAPVGKTDFLRFLAPEVKVEG